MGRPNSGVEETGVAEAQGSCGEMMRNKFYTHGMKQIPVGLGWHP